MTSPRLKDDDFDFEQQLREFSESNDPATKRNFRDVPPYLRDLLANISARYTNWPGNLIRLCAEIMSERPHHVAFITLNYDTFLEQALHFHEADTYRFEDLRHYIEPRRQAKVFKLHGSVNWLAPIGLATEDWTMCVNRLDDDLSQLADKLQVIDGGTGPVSKLNYGSSNWYPVLTAPLAGKNERSVVLPRRHLETLNSFLKHCSKLLIIGNSGSDVDLLEILDLILKQVSVMVVDSSHQSAANVFKKYATHVYSIRNSALRTVHDADGVSDFIDSPGLKIFASDM